MLPFEACRAHREAFSEGERLIALIGPEKFRLVQEAFGGRRVWIPKVGAEQPCKRCPSRDRRIRRLRAGGDSVASLAERFGLSPKRVYGILEGSDRRHDRGGKRLSGGKIKGGRSEEDRILISASNGSGR